MIKREIEWVAFAALVTLVAWYLAFPGAGRGTVDFGPPNNRFTVSGLRFFLFGISVLIVLNLLFGWMVRSGLRSPHRLAVLRPMLGIVALLVSGAAMSIGISAMPAFFSDGYDELAGGSMAVVVLMVGLVVMCIFRMREMRPDRN